MIEYAASVLLSFDIKRFDELEKMQNEAMRIILNCPRNAMIETMRVELNIPSIKDRVGEVNLTMAIRYMRSKERKD